MNVRALRWFVPTLIAAGCSYPEAQFVDDAGAHLDAADGTLDSAEVASEAGADAPCTKTLCGADCVAVSSDPKNCGVCGNVCGPTQSCVDGACKCVGGSCCTKDSDCSPANPSCCNKTCVHLANDVSNCGACGKLCGTGQSCSSGVCVCSTGFVNCSGTCVNVSSDPKNCGACGMTCGTGKLCASGACI